MDQKVVRYSCQEVLGSDDILSDILLRLPPEFAFKLILVSKRWLQLMCSPTFRISYMSQWKTGFNLVGFFICNTSYLGIHKEHSTRPPSEPAIHLLSTSKEGDDLDVSGILKPVGYFIDSSNGVLLCGRHPKYYYVCDPLTQKTEQLPYPRVNLERFCVAFIVENSLDDDLVYKMVRAKCYDFPNHLPTVSIETFDSKTRTWSYSVLTCTSSVSLAPWTTGTVIRGVIYWYSALENIAIYNSNSEERRISLVKIPGSNDYDERVLGESCDGLLQYGWSNRSELQIWVFGKKHNEDISSAEWRLRYRLNFKIMWRKNPSMATRINLRSKETKILAFLPQNNESVFIRMEASVFICHLKTQKVEEVRYQGHCNLCHWEFCKTVPFFRPAWPHASIYCAPSAVQ